MSYIDIAIIAIVVLCALIGLWKGFFKTIISFFGLLVSFIVAFFLTKPVAGALLDLDAIQHFVVGGHGGWSLFGWLSGKITISEEGALGVLLKPFIAVCVNQGVNVPVGVTLLLANAIFSVMVCIGLFIVVRFILLLFTMFANAMSKGKFVGALNRLLGLVFGAVKGAWHVCVLMFIMSFLLGFGFMAPVSGQIDNSVLASPVYSQVTKLSDRFITGGEDTLVKLIDIYEKAYKEGSGEQPETQPEHGLYTYASTGEDDSEFSIELKAGNNFEMNSGGITVRGTYSISQSSITLDYDDLPTETGEINVGGGWIKLGSVYLVKAGHVAPQD